MHRGTVRSDRRRRSVRRGARGGAGVAHRRRWRRPTSGRVRAMRRWRRRAPSQTFAATRPRSGPRHRSPTVCAPRCRESSASRPRRCASSSWKGRDRTARTAPTMPRRTRCSSRRLSGSRCACSGRARTSTVGIRRARSSCSTCVRVSMRPAASWRGTRRCGFPPTVAAPGFCWRRNRRAFPRTADATPPRSSRTVIRPIRPTTSECSRTGCATRRSTRPTCALPASPRTCSRSRASPTRLRRRSESTRSSSAPAA